MSRAEDRMAGNIDRARDKAATSARTLQVRGMAKAVLNCAVMEMPEADRAEFMNASIRHLRALYGAGEGEREAVSLFGSLAFSKELQLSRVIANARATQLFTPKAANDGDTTAGTALASAIRELGPDHPLAPIVDDLGGK